MNEGLLKMIERNAAIDLVLASVREILESSGLDVPSTLGESSIIVGQDAMLDSIGVVSLIVEVEQRLETQYNVSVTLANDRAMSQRNSPFRTVSTLVDHIQSMIEEAATA